MPSDRNRILELALESLEAKKKNLEEEIAEITRELHESPAKAATASKAPASAGSKKRPRFSKEEKARRSERKKAYWDNWRKQKAQ
jgi:hypothetical protein